MKKVLIAITAFMAIGAMALLASAQTNFERPPGFEEAAMLSDFETVPATLNAVDYLHVQSASQQGVHSFFCSPLNCAGQRNWMREAHPKGEPQEGANQKTNQKKGAQKELASLKQLFGLMAFGQRTTNHQGRNAMSYSLNAPCSTCKKDKECNDVQFIRGAIDTLHAVVCTNQGHKGSGEVVLNCTLHEQKDEPAG